VTAGPDPLGLSRPASPASLGVRRREEAPRSYSSHSPSEIDRSSIREGYVTAMVVIGPREEPLPLCRTRPAYRSPPAPPLKNQGGRSWGANEYLDPRVWEESRLQGVLETWACLEQRPPSVSAVDGAEPVVR
jgi:hypothetical protein